jgi:protease secretion system outer membrane protein
VTVRVVHTAALAAATTLALASPVQACGLAEAYAAARTNDANYDAARADLEISRLGVPMARAGLLPNVAYNTYDAKVTGERDFTNIFGQPQNADLDYRVRTRSLGLRQPLLDMERFQRFRAARLQAEAAEMLFDSEGTELSDRVATAYLRRLLAEDNLLAAQARLDAADAELARTERSLDLGEGTRTEQALAEAERDLATVGLEEARDQRVLASNALSQLTGAGDGALCTLRTSFVPPPLEGTLDSWLQRALRDNPTLSARRIAIERTGVLVEQARAGHYPRIELVGTLARNENESVSQLGQRAYQRIFGVQMQVPISQGGYVNAAVKQALAQKDKAEAELRAEENALTSELRTLFATLSQEGSRVRAHRNARDAAALALQGERRKFEQGASTRDDVQLAERRLAEATRDYARIRYEQLLARLQLFTRAGYTPEQAVAILDAWLDQPVPR